MSADEDGRIHEDLLAQQAAFFESYFKKGAEFTRELMQETQRLRTRLAELEERLSDQDRANELEQRYQQIERENNDLAALYVAQSQLHSSLDSAEVVQVISEILLNFVGADRFALLMFDGKKALRPLLCVGLDEASVPGSLLGNSQVQRIIDNGGFTSSTSTEPRSDDEPLGIIGLGSAGTTFGVICVWGYLRQKASVSELDCHIFDLISKSGGLALQASRLVGEAQARTKSKPSDGPFERFSHLIGK